MRTSRVFGKGAFTLRVSGEEIPRELIRQVWRQTYGDEPVPEKIFGYVVSRRSYLKKRGEIQAGNKASGHPNLITFANEWEYGEPDPTTIAHTFWILRREWLMFVLKNSIEPLRESIMHELKHIGDGDFTKLWTAYQAKLKEVMSQEGSIQDLCPSKDSVEEEGSIQAFCRPLDVEDEE